MHIHAAKGQAQISSDRPDQPGASLRAAPLGLAGGWGQAEASFQVVPVLETKVSWHPAEKSQVLAS